MSIHSKSAFPFVQVFWPITQFKIEFCKCMRERKRERLSEIWREKETQGKRQRVRESEIKRERKRVGDLERER